MRDKGADDMEQLYSLFKLVRISLGSVCDTRPHHSVMHGVCRKNDKELPVVPMQAAR